MEEKETLWVARDKDNSLALFNDEKKPFRVRNEWEGWNYLYLDRSLFPDLGWKDEPVGVCLCLNNEKYHTVKLETLDKLYEVKERFSELQERVDKFNSLPWYKRIFKNV